MKKILISLGILSLLLITMGLTACVQETVVCNSPYIKVGTNCCLDSNSNKICDNDENITQTTTHTETQKCEKFDCSQCDPVVVERTTTKEIKKYVCEKDNRVVNSSEECLDAAADFTYDPVKTNEKDTFINEFKIRPACRDSQSAAEIYFETSTPANNIEFQYKDNPNAQWKTIYTYNGGDEGDYLYFALCKYSTCSSNVNFFLQPNMKYLMRAKFDYEDSFGKTQYSNEWVIDATSQGEYMTKIC